MDAVKLLDVRPDGKIFVISNLPIPSTLAPSDELILLIHLLHRAIVHPREHFRRHINPSGGPDTCRKREIKHCQCGVSFGNREEHPPIDWINVRTNRQQLRRKLLRKDRSRTRKATGQSRY